MVRFWGKKDGVEYEKMLPFHKCTAEDFEEFAPPQPEALKTLEIMKESETQGLFCPDFERLDEELAIWSIADDDNY